MEFDRKRLTAGHYVPDRSKYLLFDEEGVHAQCVQCNIYKKGNWVPYRKFMIETYGEETANRIEANKDRTGSWSIPELQEKQLEYKEKYRALAKSIGITP